ncbi:MAG: carboxylesterase family protein [Gammaproteobacteria bacterium]|nr:carboxylesterase family protein [Gammaproteobacteria bacterium]
MSRSFIILLLLIALPLQSEEVEIQMSTDDSNFLANYDDEKELFIFRGIPFAEPPVGELRWQSPIPAKQSQVVDARTFKPACMQDTYTTEWYHDVIESFDQDKSMFQHVESVSEDCLYLNIWTQSIDSSEKKPVMVWIYGGNDVGGWTYEPNYLGQNLAQKDVVVVSIPYRLNIFGFFNHPEMDNQTGNFGLEDEILALQWVKDNIDQFGGDPDNITLFGESAGGAHVSYHIASPLSEGLFDRGIIQSGGYNLSNPSRLNSLDDANKLALETQNKAGALNFNELKQLSSNELLEISNNLYHPYHPIVDGELIPDDITKIFNEGALNDVDVMIGSNQNEDLLYVDENPTLEDLSKLIQWYHPNKVDEILSILDLSDLRMAMDRFGTNQNTACPSILIARSMAKTGNHVYQYLFAREREGSEKILAYHGAEIPYVFNTHDAFLPTTEEDLILTEQMMEYWTEFAKKGTPNSVDNPMTWYEFGEEENYLILDTEVRNDQKLERQFCDIMIEKLMQSAASE